MIPILPIKREYRKPQLVLSFLYVENPFSPRIQCSIISFSSHSKSFYLWKSTLSKNWRFCILPHIPHILNLLKSAIFIDMSRYLTWLLSPTTGLNLSTKVSKVLYSCRGGLVPKTIDIDLCIKILRGQRLLKNVI